LERIKVSPKTHIREKRGGLEREWRTLGGKKKKKKKNQKKRS